MSSKKDEKNTNIADELEEKTEKLVDKEEEDEKFFFSIPFLHCVNKKKVLIMVTSMIVAVFYITIFINGIRNKNISFLISSIEANDNENIEETKDNDDENKEVTLYDDKYEKFISPYKDTLISQEIKNIFQGIDLQKSSIGIKEIDDELDKIISATCYDNMTTYEKVRNIYDYIHFYFEVTETNPINELEMYELCEKNNYESLIDLQYIYRSQRTVKEFKGDNIDIACLYAVLLRKIGLESYYIETEDTGFTVINIGESIYIFDISKEEKSEDNLKNNYNQFCMSSYDKQDQYNIDLIKDEADKFKNFNVLPEFIFNVKLDYDEEKYIDDIKYVNSLNNEKNIKKSTKNIKANIGDKISINGDSDLESNNYRWKLVCLEYSGNVLVRNKVIFDESSDLNYNKYIYTIDSNNPILLEYSLIDINGRTCTFVFNINADNSDDNEINTQDSSVNTETLTTKETITNENNTTSQKSTHNVSDNTTSAQNITTSGTTNTTTADDSSDESTEESTPEPTEEPTPEPTEEPTPEPTEEPTPEPTAESTTESQEETTTEPFTEIMPDDGDFNIQDFDNLNE